MSYKNLLYILTVAFLMVFSLGCNITSPQKVKPTVFLLPHQDDEMVFAGEIVRQKMLGKEVYVVVITDGGGSSVNLILNGEEYCVLHEKFHDPKLEEYVQVDRKKMVRARNDEFFRSMVDLGIPEDHILFANDGGKDGDDNPIYIDGKLTMEKAGEYIDKLYTMIGDGTYIAVASEPDEAKYPHPDHLAIERALKNNQQITEKYFFSDMPGKGEEIFLTPDIQKIKQKALAEYFVWNPTENEFAIGGHSVGDRLKYWQENNSEYLMKKSD